MARASVLHFTPADYLSDYKTKRLDLVEHGAYCILLWHMWTASENQCEFPLDYLALAAIWGVSPEEAERITDSLTAAPVAVVKIKNKRSGSVLFSKRLSAQANQAKTFRAQQSEKGKRSGAARRANATNRSSTTVEHLLNQTPEQNEPSLSRNHVTRKRVPRARARFEEAYEAYPVHRFKEKAYAAWKDLIDSGTDPDVILEACKGASRKTTQTLEFFLADGTYLDVKKAVKKAACKNPSCENGFIFHDEGAVPCPECGS